MIARVVGLCALLSVAFLLPAMVRAEDAPVSGSEAQKAPEPPAPQMTLEEITKRLG